MFLFTFIQKCGPLSSRAYCIFVQSTNSNVLGTLAIRDVNNCVTQKSLLVDLVKIQYTRDNEGPHFCINVD